MSIDEDEQAETPAVQVARAALASAPMEATAADLDAIVRKTAMVTNGFSKKWENLEFAYALWFAYYNSAYSVVCIPAFA
jgi:hypothetical protein